MEEIQSATSGNMQCDSKTLGDELDMIRRYEHNEHNVACKPVAK
jgi:hypothetical protein